MNLEFEIITHEYEGKSFSLALDKSATDPYTKNLRMQPRLEPYLKYIFARAAETERPLKVADIGANVGGISLPLAAHGMRVLAIEALPKNFLALTVSTRTNGFANLLPINMAAYATTGLVEMSGESAWASIGTRGRGASTLVAADTIGAILETFCFADADFIKIDIEGAEVAALAGFDKIVSSNSNVEVIYESNTVTCQNFGHDQQALALCFENLGFNLYAFRSHGLMPVQSAGPMPSHLLDILATRKSEAEILAAGLRIIPMTDKHLLDSLHREVTIGHPFFIAHAKLQEPFLSDVQKQSRQWEQVLEMFETKGGLEAAEA